MLSSRKHIRAWALISAVLALAVLTGCATELTAGSKEEITTRIVVTQDFGREPMLDETIEVPSGTSAMQAIKEVAAVETAYGGGFVKAIDGTRSEFEGGTKYDWLFYINGISSNKGAGGYTLHNGDVQHWDLHDWSFRTFIPAIVGSFPEPFLNGFGGQKRQTVVLYSDPYAEDAEALRDKLTSLGVKDVSDCNASTLSEHDKQNSNLILVGTMEDELVSELNVVWDRLGFFLHFEDSATVSYAANGEPAAVYGAGCGLVQATQNPWNPKGTGACENVVWMVSGTDAAGVKGAVDALVNRTDEIEHAFAVVTANGDIIKVPQ